MEDGFTVASACLSGHFGREDAPSSTEDVPASPSFVSVLLTWLLGLSNCIALAKGVMKVPVSFHMWPGQRIFGLSKSPRRRKRLRKRLQAEQLGVAVLCVLEWLAFGRTCFVKPQRQGWTHAARHCLPRDTDGRTGPQ